MKNMSDCLHPEELAKRLDKLKGDVLFGDESCDRVTSLGPLSEQYYLLAVSAIEQAESYAKLAHMYSMRGD